MAIPFIIIGGGAAGLMAAAAAAESGISGLLLERRHRLGLKLLMCGNNRCNISHDFSAPQMLNAYGAPVAGFLETAINAFPPSQLRRWFQNLNLKTVVKHDRRIYPASENADDVLHVFTDFLRDRKFPFALNCPVADIRFADGVFQIETENGLKFEAQNVLVATGGVSYPKTGSVGDGLKFASKLGIATTPLRAGLVAVETNLPWLAKMKDTDIPDVAITIQDAQGAVVSRIRGNLLCNPDVLRGSAIFDATRICARKNLSGFSLTLDLLPGGGSLNDRMPREVALALKGVREIHSIKIPVLSVRPLKEAIVTVGGVSLNEIYSKTMECKSFPGLYFAGETLDIDGPTGGFNLHAAFATARLAVAAVAEKLGRKSSRSNSDFKERKQHFGRDFAKGRKFGNPQRNIRQRWD